MTWALFGWLLPTLLLLPFEPEAAPQPSSGAQRSHPGSRLVALWGRAEAAAEAWLRGLRPQPLRADGPDEGVPNRNRLCAMSWVLTVSMLWLACCAAATLYGDGSPDALSHCSGALCT